MTKSDRNLSHLEALKAGLLSDYETTPPPMIKKRASDWIINPPAGMTYDIPDPSYDQSGNKQLLYAIKNTFDKVEVNKSLMSTEAVKADAGKLDWSLVPFKALEGMVEVLEFGAKKYSAWNWTTGGGFKWARLIASTLRHIFAFARGEDNDPESGLSHISHAQCNLLFLAYYIRNKNTVNDNRHKV